MIKVSHITPKFEPTDDSHAASKAYVDSISENDRNRSEVSLVFDDQDHEFDNTMLAISESSTDIRNPLKE